MLYLTWRANGIQEVIHTLWHGPQGKVNLVQLETVIEVKQIDVTPR
jgi:hypothetical protein